MIIRNAKAIYLAAGSFRREDDFQIATARFLDALADRGKLAWFFSGNNIYRRALSRNRRMAITLGSKLKRMGAKAGIPDCIVWSHNGFIELKVPKGRLSAEQREFINAAKDWGWIGAVAASSEEVVDALRRMGVEV